MQLVVFALGDEEYGLPITQVQEIIRFSQPRTIPNPHASIRGVINLRGRIIPVCDLKLSAERRHGRGRRRRVQDRDRGVGQRAPPG